MDRKILIACFLGGVVCSATAFLVNPSFWWLGIPAGFIAGYFAYEFRTAVHESRLLFSEFFHSTGDLLWETTKEIWGIVCFLAEPLQVYAIVIAGIILLSVIQPESPMAVDLSAYRLQGVFEFLFVLAGASLFCWCCICLFLLVSYAFEPTGIIDLSVLRKLGWIETGGRILQGIGKMVGMVCFWVPWNFGKLVFYLVKRIHSNKRSLCGLDGALGGAISYLTMPHQGVASALLMVAFGGLYGAALGMAVWYWFARRQQPE